MNRCRLKRSLLLFCLVGLLAWPALAHKKHLSKSRWRVRAAEGIVGVTMGMEASDLAIAVALGDMNSNLPLGSKERQKAVRDHILKAMSELIVVTGDGQPCSVRPLRVLRKKFYELGLRWTCGKPITQLDFELKWLERLPKDHRHVATLSLGDGRRDVRSFHNQKTRYHQELPTAKPLPPEVEVESEPELAPTPDDEASEPQPSEAQSPAGPTVVEPQARPWLPLAVLGGGLLLAALFGLTAIIRKRRSAAQNA